MSREALRLVTGRGEMHVQFVLGRGRCTSSLYWGGGDARPVCCRRFTTAPASLRYHYIMDQPRPGSAQTNIQVLQVCAPSMAPTLNGSNPKWLKAASSLLTFRSSHASPLPARRTTGTKPGRGRADAPVRTRLTQTHHLACATTLISRTVAFFGHVHRAPCAASLTAWCDRTARCCTVSARKPSGGLPLCPL